MPRNKVPRPLRTGKIEARYGANITTLLEPFKAAVESELFPMLDYITQASPVRHDAAGDDIRKIFEKIRVVYDREFTDRKINEVARDNASMVDTLNHATFRKQTRAVLGVDPLFSEPWLSEEMEAFVHENASLIKSIPPEHLSDIEQMVYRDAKRGLSPGAIKTNVVALFKAADTQAALIARDQVSKFNGRLSELRQTAAGVTHYIWRTAEDGRVRSMANSNGYSNHQNLNGETFSWKSAPVTVLKGKRGGERNHPGQDINCRCYSEPLLGKLIKGK